MPAPGELTRDELVALTKQALANQTGGLMDDAWYRARVNAALSRVCTFQGLVTAPGVRRPQFRTLRFFELYNDNDQTLAFGDYTGPPTTNYTVPATSNPIVYVDNVYNLTDDKQLERKSIRYLNSLNPEQTGKPLRWAPGGKGAVGYYIHPIPSVAAENISVRERTYEYPPELTTDVAPIIPAAWHKAIWLAAAAEGASLIDWPEKEAEMEQRFMAFIAERRSPVEEAGAAGGRRWYGVGGI
jgi:hypothetical protein